MGLAVAISAAPDALCASRAQIDRAVGGRSYSLTLVNPNIATSKEALLFMVSAHDVMDLTTMKSMKPQLEQEYGIDFSRCGKNGCIYVRGDHDKIAEMMVRFSTVI